MIKIDSNSGDLCEDVDFFSKGIVKVFKNIPEAIIPQRTKDNMSLLDLHIVKYIKSGRSDTLITFDTGLEIDPPNGYAAMIIPHKNLARHHLRLVTPEPIVGRTHIIITMEKGDKYKGIRVQLPSHIGYIMFVPYGVMRLEIYDAESCIALSDD